MPDWIEEHDGAAICGHCGTALAQQPARPCIRRLAPERPRPRPEPFDARPWEIGERMIEIRQSVPCARNPALRLYDCLRSPTKCAAECPHAHEWIGPPLEAAAA